MFVAIEDGQPVHILHRDNRFGETSFRPGARRALLRFDRISVDVVAREAIFRRDEIGRDALRHEIGWNRDGRIDRPGPAGRANAHAAHALDAAADCEIVLAGHDLRCGEIHRVETGCAETVDLHARRDETEPGRDRSGARNVAAGFADRIDATHHDVVNGDAIDVIALLDGLESRDGEAERRNLMQRAIGLAASARRSHGVVDIGFGHFELLIRRIENSEWRIGRAQFTRYSPCATRL